MNIETKTVREDTTEYEKFGWKHTDDKRVGGSRCHHTEHILARDKDMPNYRLIAALETKYFTLKSQKKTYNPMDPTLCILLFLLLVIPLLVYVGFKASQQERFAAHNAALQLQMDGVLKEVAPLL